MVSLDHVITFQQPTEATFGGEELPASPWFSSIQMCVLLLDLRDELAIYEMINEFIDNTLNNFPKLLKLVKIKFYMNLEK